MIDNCGVEYFSFLMVVMVMISEVKNCVVGRKVEREKGDIM